MALIDIGPTAIGRATFQYAADFTWVFMDNPSNDTGTITAIEIWAYLDMSGTKAGTFYGSGTTYTSRDYETIGDVAEGSKQTFSGLDIDVQTDDYIGILWTGGRIERDTAGYAGIYYISGDQFGQGQQTYTLYDADGAYSVYGTGETPPAGWTGKISGVTNPAKVMGVAVANISKVKGVS